MAEGESRGLTSPRINTTKDTKNTKARQQGHHEAHEEHQDTSAGHHDSTKDTSQETPRRGTTFHDVSAQSATAATTTATSTRHEIVNHEATKGTNSHARKAPRSARSTRSSKYDSLDTLVQERHSEVDQESRPQTHRSQIRDDLRAVGFVKPLY